MSKPLTERLENGSVVVHLEAVEAFLDRCEQLEIALCNIKTILDSKELNDKILDFYEPEKNPVSEDITKALLAIKQVLAKVL